MKIARYDYVEFRNGSKIAVAPFLKSLDDVANCCKAGLALTMAQNLCKISENFFTRPEERFEYDNGLVSVSSDGIMWDLSRYHPGEGQRWEHIYGVWEKQVIDLMEDQDDPYHGKLRQYMTLEAKSMFMQYITTEAPVEYGTTANIVDAAERYRTFEEARDKYLQGHCGFCIAAAMNPGSVNYVVPALIARFSKRTDSNSADYKNDERRVWMDVIKHYIEDEHGHEDIFEPWFSLPGEKAMQRRTK